VIKHCVELLMRKSRPEYFEEFTAGDLPIAENVFSLERARSFGEGSHGSVPNENHPPKRRSSV